MVTKNSHFTISFVVGIQFLLQSGVLEVFSIEKSLKSDGSIESTENLGGQSLHLIGEMLVQGSRLRRINKCSAFDMHFTKRLPHSHTVEQTIVDILVFFEYSYIFEYLRFDFDSVVISDRVLAQEVKDNDVRSLQRDVFTAQRTAANSVCFIFTLLVPSTKSELVDEIHGCGTLSISHYFRLQIFGVTLANVVHMFLTVSMSILSSRVPKNRFMITFNSRAFSNFCMSLWPFNELPAARKTYL